MEMLVGLLNCFKPMQARSSTKHLLKINSYDISQILMMFQIAKPKKESVNHHHTLSEVERVIEAFAAPNVIVVINDPQSSILRFVTFE
jgi:hypothetical protein